MLDPWAPINVLQELLRVARRLREVPFLQQAKPDQQIPPEMTQDTAWDQERQRNQYHRGAIDSIPPYAPQKRATPERDRSEVAELTARCAAQLRLPIFNATRLACCLIPSFSISIQTTSSPQDVRHQCAPVPNGAAKIVDSSAELSAKTIYSAGRFSSHHG